MAGTRSPVPIVYLDESIGFLVPSFLRPDGSGPSSLRSGLSSLRPGLSSPTYRFITPSPPSGKAASLTPGIIYTIIVNTLVRRMPVLKTPNGLNLISTVRAGTKTRLELLTMRRGPPPVCLVRSSFLSYVPFVTLKSFLQVRWDASPNPHYYTRGTRLRAYPVVSSRPLFRSIRT